MGETTERTLVDVWDAYIYWEKRAEGAADFFTSMLNSFNVKIVLDASMGTGFDAISLTKAGFSVIGNEFDMHFRDKAKANIRREGIELKAIIGHDWRELSHYLPEAVDAVLCGGNSLCYFLKREDQLRTLHEFYTVLPAGGIAVIDQRNYEHILKNSKHILKNPKKNFHYSRKYYYCSEVVISYPVFISPGRVDIEVFDNEKQQSYGIMQTYPFCRQELVDLLFEVGFKAVETYGDFKKEHDPQAVDFFQHIAVK